MNYLVDVNVWTALALVGHVHHEVAKAWFEESDTDVLMFCRVTQHGLLRLLTNGRVMGDNVLAASDAWDLYDRFRKDERVYFADEPPGLEGSWRYQTSHQHTGANFWTDAYLAAFAASAGYTVVSFDRQFVRGKAVSLRLLS